MQPRAEGLRAGVADAAAAQRLVAETGVIVGRFGAVLREETEHIAAGRIRAGLALEERKVELAASYLRALEQMKANAVALARFAPAALAAFKAEHALFKELVDRNQAVLATARAVSEGLIKEFAAEMTRRSRPADYRPDARQAQAARPSVAPLALSIRM